MTLLAGRLHIEGRFLRSRVARRIFLSVVLCALLPIAGFAAISLRQVTGELEREGEAQLAHDAKQIGMTALEKLVLLDATLHVLDTALLQSGPTPSIGALPAPLRELARGRIVAVAVAGAAEAAGEEAGREPARAGATGRRSGGATTGAAPTDSALLAAFRTEDASDRRHLEQGGALLRVVENGGDSTIAIAHLAGSGPQRRLVAAAVDPGFVFAREALRSFVALRVVTEGGASVFHSAGGDAAAAANREADPRLGGRRVALAGTGRLAGSWALFLRPVFRAPSWSIVVSEPADAILAPVRQFRATFPLVAVLSLLGVVLASLVLVRRQLVPIETLRAATLRMADRDFSARVEIETGDEFEDLGRSFNRMTESIAHHVAVMETVNTVGTALSVEEDRTRLLETILRGAMAVTGAAAGALHFVNESDELERAILLENDAPRAGARAKTLDALASAAARAGAAASDAGSGALSIPMRNHEAEVIGVLQLVAPPAAGTFGDEARALAESLASQTAVALTRDRLAGEFRALFEGLIQLLVKAIDEKSPYTGAHCRRVPVLTEMIADAACAASEGPLKEFTLSPAERYELRIAALLHDCGKVTTPVHVQDKATKLEALFDRIDLVDVRFEVAKREVELAHSRKESTGDLGATLRAMDEDRAFLRQCNTGGEFMDRALQDRVRAIAVRWRWHGPDGTERPILEPEEAENLTIPRGTLSEAEREIVNQHVVSTIRMLEQLPYPKSLRNVPFIAGCHHERMDGAGYPNGLTREQMSLQARILGLADVFEALTAKDRPYKPGLTVKTVLGILSRMRDEGHIDSDLFDVFVGQKVHLRYAAQWLDPEQIDDDLLDEVTLSLLASARDGAAS